VERTPIAFVQIGSRAALIDGEGVIMDLPRGASYSFPVIDGMSDGEPISTRAARMRIYQRVVRDLDSGGQRYSRDISEVDLSDPDDAKITVASQPAGSEPAPNGGAVLIHLGKDQYLERYKLFIAHIAEWRQQYPQLDSVDLRYDGQVVVNPESGAMSPGKQPLGKQHK
jgi:cell division protein FtsQ